MSAPVTDPDRIVVALNDLGITAYCEGGPGPTDIVVPTSGGADLLLARGHNVDGWEAVVEVDAEQHGVPDGPGPDAPAVQVAAWVDTLLASDEVLDLLPSPRERALREGVALGTYEQHRPGCDFAEGRTTTCTCTFP